MPNYPNNNGRPTTIPTAGVCVNCEHVTERITHAITTSTTRPPGNAVKVSVPAAGVLVLVAALLGALGFGLVALRSRRRARTLDEIDTAESTSDLVRTWWWAPKHPPVSNVLMALVPTAAAWILVEWWVHDGAVAALIGVGVLAAALTLVHFNFLLVAPRVQRDEARRELDRLAEEAEAERDARPSWKIESVGDPSLVDDVIRVEIRNAGDQGSFGASLESLMGPGDPLIDSHLQLRWMNHQQSPIIIETIPPGHKRTVGVGTLTIQKFGRDYQTLYFRPLTPTGPGEYSYALAAGTTTIGIQVTESVGSEGYSKPLAVTVQWEPFAKPVIGWASCD